MYRIELKAALMPRGVQIGDYEAVVNLPNIDSTQVHIEYKVGTYNLPVELIQSPAIRTHEIVLTEAFRQANDINIGDTVYCVVGGGPPANDTSSDDSSNQSEVEFLNPELLIRMNDRQEGGPQEMSAENMVNEDRPSGAPVFYDA